MKTALLFVLMVASTLSLAQNHPVPSGHPSFQKEGSGHSEKTLIETASSSPEKGRWPKVKGVKPIHVLTWNIYMIPNFLLWKGQFRRAKAIGELLKEENYDIILFQEAFGKGSRKRLRKALEGKFPYEIEPQNNGKLVNSGLWILSKHEIEESDFIFFDNCLVNDCQSSKGAVLFEVEIDGQRYQFVSTHVQAEDGKKFADVRAKQFEMIRELLDSKKEESVPQFILGDLNTPYDSMADYKNMLRILNARDGDVSIIGENTLSGDVPITWGCKNNDMIPKKWKGHVQLLDYALQHENNYPFKVRRELKTYTKQWSKKHQHLSDHYALTLTILP